MPYVLTMPKLGLSMTEGTLTRWIKNEGDAVKQGEEIVEIETDKINHVIESPADGYLRLILIKENDIGQVTVPIGIIADLDEDISEWHDHSAPTVATAAVQGKKEEQDKRAETEGQRDQQGESDSRPVAKNVLSTPAAKAFAGKHGLMIEDITGSGPAGRIQERDVIQYFNHHQNPAARFTPAAQKYAADQGMNIEGFQQQERVHLNDVQKRVLVQETQHPGVKRIPLKGIRKATASKMEESWRSIPHVTLHKEVNITELVKFNKSYIPGTLLAQEDKITWTHQLVKACAIALEQCEYMNSAIEGNEILYHQDIHIGVAAATDKGLLVPVIKDVNRKGILQISRDLKRLTIAARNQQLNPDDLQGGTFTISNLGMYDIQYFTPIINPPQAAILGVGKIKHEDQYSTLFLSLSFDHRIIDGVDAARFLKEIEQILQHPLRLFI